MLSQIHGRLAQERPRSGRSRDVPDFRIRTASRGRGAGELAGAEAALIWHFDAAFHLDPIHRRLTPDLKLRCQLMLLLAAAQPQREEPSVVGIAGVDHGGATSAEAQGAWVATIA